jgi:hypothetical protein
MWLLAGMAALAEMTAMAKVEEVELGIYDINSQETTPIMWHGEHMMKGGC